MNMLPRYFLFLSSIVAMLVFASCGNNKADEIIPLVDSTCIETGHIVNYTDDIKAILETHCTASSLGVCHQPEVDGGTIGLDYTTYGGIKPEVDNGQLAFRVLDLMDMPSAIATPPQTMTECELLLIETWIANGGPEN